MTLTVAGETSIEERLEAITIVDVDTHVTEPRDLWSSRLPRKFVDQAPHVVVDPQTGAGQWYVGDHLIGPEMRANHAGWRERWPSVPPTPEEADPAGWDPYERLRRMDEHGVGVHILYPNIVGFQLSAFMHIGDPDLGLACIRAYNDFQTDFASADPRRLVPVANLPLWDVDASIAELERCAAMGHRGVNFAPGLERIGLPEIASDHWTPLLATAQDLEMPVSFHIGFQSFSPEASRARFAVADVDPLKAVMATALLFAGNLSGIAEVIMRRVCHRFPRLNFVSVESGFGYVPYLLEALDWQFVNNRASEIFSDMLLPSEYFRRQIFATFWFERGLHRQVDLYPDNLMFESDFPHPTCLAPGPATIAESPRDTVIANLGPLSDEHLRKVLHDTAARVYRL